MATTFSFDNAAFHFVRTDGPSGFLPRFLLAYGLGVILLAAIGFFALMPIFSAYVEAMGLYMQGASERMVEREISEAILGNLGRVALGYIGTLLAYAVFWSMMEAAVLRRYVRDEGFSLRWSGDEWRMLGIGLTWFAFFIGAYIVSILATLGLVAPFATMMEDNPALIGLWAGLVVLAIMLTFLLVAIKLSPAGAMSIRDQKFTLFGAWGATKGRFWPMLGAFAVLGLILYLGLLVLYLIGGVAVFGTIFSQVDVSQPEYSPDEVIAMITNPGVLIPFGLLYLALLVFQGFWQYAWAGIPALAAKTDPRTGGLHNAADSFS